MRKFLKTAKKKFKQNNHDGLIVCFGGHGDETLLLCSEYKRIYPITIIGLV